MNLSPHFERFATCQLTIVAWNIKGYNLSERILKGFALWSNKNVISARTGISITLVI